MASIGRANSMVFSQPLAEVKLLNLITRMKKLCYFFAILLPLMAGCNPKSELVDAATPSSGVTRSVNLDPTNFCGNPAFNGELYSADEICDIVYHQLNGVDDTLANRILNCPPTAILTYDVLPSAIRIARAFNHAEFNSPDIVNRLDSFAPTLLYLFEPQQGGYVLACADQRIKSTILYASANESFPFNFFEHYLEYSYACEVFLPEIYSAISLSPNDSTYEEKVDAKLTQRLLREGIGYIDEFKNSAT